MPGEDEVIRVRAEFVNDVSEPAKAAEQSVSSFGNESVESAAKVEVLEREIAQLRRELEKLAAAEKLSTKSRSDSTKGMNQQAIAQREAARLSRLHAASKKAEKAEIDKLFETMNKLTRVMTIANRISKLGGIMSIFNVAKLFLVIQLLQNLAGVLSAVGAGGYAAISGLAPLSGLMVAYPGILLAVVQGFAAVKLATSGVGDAMEKMSAANKNWTEIQMAMNKLTPAARQFATEYASLRKQFTNRIKATAQENIFSGINDGMVGFKKLLPVFEQGMGETSKVIGDIARQAGKLANEPMFRKQLAEVMHTNAAMLRDMGDGGLHLVDALFGLLRIARPLLLWMSNGFKVGAQNINAFVHSADGENRIANYLDRTQKVAAGAWRVVKNFFVGFSNISKAARGTSDWMGEGFENLSKKFRKWTGSAEGQLKITKWFDDARPVLKELGRLIGGLAGFFENTQPEAAAFLKLINDEFVPALKGLMNSTAGSNLPKALIDVASGFAGLLAVVGGGFSRVLTIIGGTLSFIANILGYIPTPILTTVFAILAFIQAATWMYLALKKLYIVKFITLLLTAQGRALIATRWAAFVSGVQAATVAMWEFTVVMLTNPWTYIVLGIVLIVAALVYMALHWDKTKKALSKIWGAISDVFRSKVGIILAILFPFIGLPLLIIANWDRITEFFSNMWHIVGASFTIGINKIKNGWKDLKTWIADTATSMKERLVDIANSIVTALLTPLNWLIDQANSVIRSVNNAGPTVFGRKLDLNPFNTSQIQNINPVIPGGSKKDGDKIVAPGNKTRPEPKWSGGPVFANHKPYLVGERGVEHFKDLWGNLSKIGTKGPEVVTFQNPGVVIPNHQDPKHSVPRRAVQGASGVKTPEPRHQGGGTVTIEGDHVNITIQGNDISPDIEQRLEAMLRRRDAEKAARAIHWRKGGAS